MNMPADMTYARRIRELRKRLGLSQRALAERLEVSESTVRMWELGKSRAHNPTLAKIVDAFGISLDWLYGLEENAESAEDAIARVPVLGVVRGGVGGVAYEAVDGYEPVPADIVRGDARHYFFLRVVGGSMSPRIDEGDLVLVRQQDSVDSGDLAVVIIDGDEGVVKRVLHSGANVRPDKPDSFWIELLSENPAYPPRRFIGEEVERVRVVGRVLRVMREL